MSDTYTQLLVQIVFAVRGRKSLIKESFREPVQKYICGIISNSNCKPLAIYCNPDHIHILVGLHPNISVSELTRLIKCNSSKWINENNWIASPFSWQAGFGAFSYSKSQLDNVVRYILNQPEHHKKIKFKEEYLDLLDQFSIKFKDQYLFDFID